MIKEIVEKWEKNKGLLRNYLSKNKIDSYEDLVYQIVNLVLNDNDLIDNYNEDRITVIDDGDYQGTQIFLIPRSTYQPDANDYIFTDNYYGSCSGCDSLLAIIEFANLPYNEEQINDLMQLALGLIEGFRYLIPRKEKNNG